VGRLFVVAALAALSFAVSVPAGLADFGAVSRYVDRGATIAVSYDFQSGNYSIVTRFAKPFTGDARYSIYFDTDKRRATGSPSGAEYRLHLFANGNVSWARWQRDAGWVETDGSVTESPPSRDRKLLDIAISRNEIGGVTAFDFSVDGDAPSSRQWSYPASAAWLHDQTVAAHGLLHQSDLGPVRWQFLPGDYGARCVSGRPTAVGRAQFNEPDSPSTAASSSVFVYGTPAQARRAFANLHASLIRCYRSFTTSDYALVTGLPTGGLVATFRQDSSTVQVRMGYSLAGRGLVLFTQITMGSDLPFSTAQEAAFLRLMASRLS